MKKITYELMITLIQNGAKPVIGGYFAFGRILKQVLEIFKDKVFKNLLKSAKASEKSPKGILRMRQKAK